MSRLVPLSQEMPSRELIPIERETSEEVGLSCLSSRATDARNRFPSIASVRPTDSNSRATLIFGNATAASRAFLRGRSSNRRPGSRAHESGWFSDRSVQ